MPRLCHRYEPSPSSISRRRVGDCTGSPRGAPGRLATEDLVADALLRVLDPDDVHQIPEKGTFLTHMSFGSKDRSRPLHPAQHELSIIRVLHSDAGTPGSRPMRTISCLTSCCACRLVSRMVPATCRRAPSRAWRAMKCSIWRVETSAGGRRARSRRASPRRPGGRAPRPHRTACPPRPAPRRGARRAREARGPCRRGGPSRSRVSYAALLNSST